MFSTVSFSIFRVVHCTSIYVVPEHFLLPLKGYEIIMRHKYIKHSVSWKIPTTCKRSSYRFYWLRMWIRTHTSDPWVSTPRLACFSSLKCIKLSKGEIATFICPWHSPLKSVMLYQPQTNWKPERSGERSTEAKPITLSSSVGKRRELGIVAGHVLPLRLKAIYRQRNWLREESVIPKPIEKTNNEDERDNHSLLLLLWIPFLYGREKLAGSSFILLI